MEWKRFIASPAICHLKVSFFPAILGPQYSKLWDGTSVLFL